MFKYLCFSLMFTMLSISCMDCSLSRLSPQQERDLLGKEFYDLLVAYNQLTSRKFPCEQCIAICRKNLNYIAAQTHTVQKSRHEKLSEKYQAKAVPRALNDIAQEK